MPSVSISNALLLSLEVALLAVVMALPPAVFIGWLTARKQFPGKTLLSTLVMAPLVLPPVVTGYLLLAVFGRRGLLGPVLEVVGLELAFTRWGAVLAAAVVGFPLLVLMTRIAIESVDPRYEAMARTLGDSRLQCLWRITLPMAAPGIGAGAMLAFARALGEFGATTILAGNIEGETRTLSMAIYVLLESPGGEEPAATLVWISLGVAVVALAIYEGLSRWQKARLAPP